MPLRLATLIKKSFSPNAYDTSQDNKNPTPTAPPHLHSLQQKQPLSVIPRLYRKKTAITGHTPQEISFPQKPVPHIAVHQSNI